MITLKRTIAIAMAAVVLGTSIPTPTQAAVVANSYSEYVLTLQNRCSELETLFQKPVTGSTSALYQLQLLSEYYLSAGFLIKYREQMPITDLEIQQLQSKLKHYTEYFNALYADETKPILQCELMANFISPGDSWKSIKRNVVEVIPQYLEKVITEVSKGVVSTDPQSEEFQVFMQNNRTVLSAVFVVHETLADVYELLQSYETAEEEFSIKVGDKELPAVLEALETDHESVFQAAEEYVIATGSNTQITVDLTRPLVENLGDLVDSNGSIQIDTSPTTSLLYKSYVAASATYEPMKSYVGDATFLASLDYVIGDKTTSDAAKQLFNKLKDVRKPLYYREYDDEGAPTGNAVLITVREFVEMIQNSGSGALCTIKGEFRYDSDSGQWIYDLTNTDTVNTVGGTLESAEEIRHDDSLENAGVVAEPTDAPASEAEEPDEEQDEGFNLFGWLEPQYASATTVDQLTPSETDEGAEEPELSATDKLINATAGEQKEQESTTVQNNTGVISPEQSSDSGQAVTDKVLSAVYGVDVVTDETRMSDAVLMFGTRFARAVDNMTSVVLTNVLADTVLTDQLLEKSEDFLYVNVFGDIVTADNLVVLPAIANPIIYNYTKEGAETDSSNPFAFNTQLIDTSKSIATGYYPFSVAFMNSYATPIKHSSQFTLLNRTDIGKYLILGTVEKSEETTVSVLNAAKLMSIDQVRSTAPLVCPPIVTSFATKPTFSDNVLGTARLIFGSSQEWTEDNGIYYYSPLVTKGYVMVDGTPIFPYSATEDPKKELAQTIALAAFYYLSTNCKSANAEEAARLNENYIIHNFIVSNVTGTNNPSGFSKSKLAEYEVYTRLSNQRFLQTLTKLVSDAYDVVSDADGIIGLADSYSDPILGRAIGIFTDYWYMVMGVVLLVLLYFLARSSIGFTAGVTTVASTVLGMWLFMMVIPIWIPAIFNWVINDVSSTFVYKIVAAKLEYYSDTTELWDVDREGDQKFSNSSLTLYRTSSADLGEFLTSLNTQATKLTGGNTVTINEEAGVFAEGDSIKVNLNKMLSQLKISTERTVEDGKNYYKFSATKTVSNNVDYYTPYYLITDAFVEKLNKLAKIYEMPKLTDTYVNDTVKENYVVHSYVHSRPFVTPTDYTVLIPKDHQHWTEAEFNEFVEEESLVMQELSMAFPNNVDFLGIANIVFYPTDAMKKTLWYETMKQNGFYAEDGTPNEEMLNHLVSYVNMQTRKFVYDMEDEIGVLSDDVMIKIIALRATMAFGHKCSNVGSMLYPFALDSSSLTLDDVVPMIFVDDYQRYLSKDMNVVEYVADSYGAVHLVAFALTIFLLFVVTQIISVAIPVLYLVLGGLLLLKITKGGGLQTVVNGFARVFAVSMVIMTVISWLLNFLNGRALEAKAIYAVLAVMVVVSFVVASLVDAVVHNFTELGGEVSTMAMVKQTTELYSKHDFNLKRQDDFDFDEMERYRNSRYGSERHSDYDDYPDRYSQNRRFPGSRYGSDAYMYDNRFDAREFSNTYDYEEQRRRRRRERVQYDEVDDLRGDYR